MSHSSPANPHASRADRALRDYQRELRSGDVRDWWTGERETLAQAASVPALTSQPRDLNDLPAWLETNGMKIVGSNLGEIEDVRGLILYVAPREEKSI